MRSSAATRASPSTSSARWWSARTARKSTSTSTRSASTLLLNGLDDIGQTLQHGAAIDTYEADSAEAAGAWMPCTAA